MTTVIEQSNRALPIVNVTKAAMNFSAIAADYISADTNQFILSSIDNNIFLLPVRDAINFSAIRYDLGDTRVVTAGCIFRAKKEGAVSKSNRFTSAVTKTLEVGKYRIVGISVKDAPMELKYIGKQENIDNILINRVYQLVKIETSEPVKVVVDIDDTKTIDSIVPEHIEDHVVNTDPSGIITEL